MIREPPFDDVAAAAVITTNDVDPHSGELIESAESFRRDHLRGDLLLIRGDDRLLVDVVIPRPTAPTRLNHPTLAPHINGLATAAAAEKAKHAKYDEACRLRGWKMTAFAVESYGSLGSEARKLLNTLASHSDEMSAEAFLHHAMASLNVALQAGNAAIAFGGLQRLRTEQLAWELPLSPGLNGHPSRRRIARHSADVWSRPLDLESAFHPVLRGGATSGGCVIAA